MEIKLKKKCPECGHRLWATKAIGACLQHKVLECIDSGITTFTAICCKTGMLYVPGDPNSFRKVDRVLQRLRKYGLIIFDTKLGWVRKP